MGTDIHPYLEIKHGDTWRYVGSLERGRNYDFFSALSGVRGDGNDGYFYSDGGLPDDCSDYVREESEGNHSFTIVSFKGLCEFNKEHEDTSFDSHVWEIIMKPLAEFCDDMRVVVSYDS